MDKKKLSGSEPFFEEIRDGYAWLLHAMRQKVGNVEPNAACANNGNTFADLSVVA
eukprot:m.117213 g.117213  ORF g.117213 m.117213 type:complete len:55 (+) comp15420_c0_seq1:996-1160(+)